MHAVWIILLAPLAAAAAITLGARRSPGLSAGLSIAALLTGFALSLKLLADFAGGGLAAPAAVPWLDVAGFQASFGAVLDAQSVLMLLVVTGVGSAIQIYSVGYMRGDPGYARYFACMSLFAFSMLGIVLADNFIQLFIFWELVGVSSYLLIGFWFGRPSAAEAAKKAFLVNRVGDFGFLLGILVLWLLTGHFDFVGIEAGLPGLQFTAVGAAVVALLIFSGAVGKSAQFPLHVWLPDAMEGPTPVSALIHAATMVAAGVYMMCRVAWILLPSEIAAAAVAWIGGGTAVLAALLAVGQNDLKRILAYSTLSQLGYMMMAVGLGGSVQAMFHLTTHAFFKALLFLGAGSVIHVLHHEQDIWRMGGLRAKMPVTFATFLVGTLALAGVWPLSGFYSKDEILLLALGKNPALFAVAVFTAALTAFYMGRAFFVAFLGRPRDAAVHAHAHESPWVMTGPLIFLAVLSLVGGWGSRVPRFLDPELHVTHPALPLTLALLAAPAAGFALAAWLYARTAPAADPLASALGPLHRVLVNKFYVDEFYALLVRYVQGGLAAACDLFDRWIIRGLAQGLVATGGMFLGALVRVAQNGQIGRYAFVFGAGVVVVLYVVLFR